MNGLSFKVACDACHDIQCFTDLDALFSSKPIREFIHPAIAFFNALLNEFRTLIGETEQLGAAVVRILHTLDQSTVDKFIHELTGGSRGDIISLADPGHAAGAAIMQLHEYAELRHRQPCRFGEASPSAHGAVHKNIHPRTD